ncbi:hypothetical protein [Butyrivibrio sp.]|uniref:hypothetical protein n=1 Tax=Butyrivibrio sp. TaxID=28121 RepID=UPI0025BEC662|nr:hypothetical protein [Butyrivibrio sp.]MBE5838218.1 hypothetical protein [Butyrivibrio sp.]
MKKNRHEHTIKDLEKVLFSDEVECIPGKSHILYDKAQNYKEACELLKVLSKRGLLSFNADDPLRPYFLHSIWIKWNFENINCPEVDTKDLIDIFAKMDSLLLDNEGISSDWQLSSKLYVMTE